jgi:hypothetical protein
MKPQAKYAATLCPECTRCVRPATPSCQECASFYLLSSEHGAARKRTRLGMRSLSPSARAATEGPSLSMGAAHRRRPALAGRVSGPDCAMCTWRWDGRWVSFLSFQFQVEVATCDCKTVEGVGWACVYLEPSCRVCHAHVSRLPYTWCTRCPCATVWFTLVQTGS